MGLSGLDMIVSLVFGYLCGTIPFGLILTKSAGLGDIRSIGSGNIGATNVLRTGNKKVAALTLVLDALKGTVPALLHGLALRRRRPAILGGLAAFFGHLFPMWLGFKGGKGVATTIGVLFGLYWPLGLIFIARVDRDGGAVPHLVALGADGQLPVALRGLARWGAAT